jgi:arsenite-transporting ATPase
MILGKSETLFEFFGGKGGVGKTTMAAARALWLADNGKKVLVISTDPAHSLSDSFEKKIGGKIKELEKNLYAVEIDPKEAVKDYKEKISMDQLEQLQNFGIGGEEFDLAAMTPGIDEMAAFDKFIQYMDEKDYDYIIFDTAPTGHTLRFLSLPDVMEGWVGRVIRIRAKFSQITDAFKKLLPFTEPKEDQSLKVLEELKEKIRQAKEIMADKNRTHFNIVMIPEEMSIFESERAMESLKEYNLPIRNVLVNQIIPKNPDCDFCSTKRKQQMERLGEIKNKFSDKNILEIPMFKHEVKGMNKLRKLGEILYS